MSIESYYKWFNQRFEVPEIFHSFQTSKPMDRCITCEKYLLEEGTRYIIEKAIRTYPDFGTQDVIFEYAVCSACAEDMKKQMSGASVGKLEKYFRSKKPRLPHVDLHEESTVEEVFLQQCFIKGTPRQALTQYQLLAYCDGPFLSSFERPFLLSHNAAEEVQELLSPETKEELDRFTEENFGLPPEWKKALTEDLILF